MVVYKPSFADLTMPNRIYINIAKVKGRNEFIRAQ